MKGGATVQQVRCDKKVVVFGELMMRLGTKGHQRLVQAREFDVSYSGAEANVAVGLQGLGIDSYIVSSVPANAVGDACLMFMRQFAVNLDHVRRNGSRLGIYYVETGASQRASTFLYNRQGSSITELRPADFDWDTILEGKHWFHLSGITPALSDDVAAVALDAAAEARRKRLTVSLDLNFRRKLWSPEKAQRVLSDLAQHVDVLFTNEEEAAAVFGIGAQGADVTAGRVEDRAYERVAAELIERFPQVSTVLITLRESVSATVNGWSGMLFDGKRSYVSRRYLIDHIVDRVGGGDAFSVGVIYGMLTGQEPQDTVDFAAAASCLKHSIPGDINLASFDEVRSLMEGDGSGRIQR